MQLHCQSKSMQQQLVQPCCRSLLIACLLLAGSIQAQAATPDAGLFVRLTDDGRLGKMEVEESTFEVRLRFAGESEPFTRQDWQYNIYSQFYFPGEDPGIDYTFLGNRRYSRLLQKLDRSAALIWVSTSATRAEAEKLRDELASQGLEGAFVARVRGEFGHVHTESELAGLTDLASRLDPGQCKGEDPLQWLTEQDLSRRWGMRLRLLYVDVPGSINEALALRDSLKSGLGSCGMLNRPGGGYRLFCGAFESRENLLDAYADAAAISGSIPVVICLNGNGQQTRWIKENLLAP
jgi:hypothetical protein